MNKLETFFNPKSIAIVGASPNQKKLGHILEKNIRSGGWKGKTYRVNPKHKNISGEKCYTSLSEIKRAVDLVLIAIPAPFVPQSVAEGARSLPKIENYAIISSGFKETGKAGGELENTLVEIAREFDLNILGPNCLGFMNSRINLNATFTSSKMHRGKIAIVSQSGALEVALLDWAEVSNIGFSKAISIGNKAIIDESALIKYLSADRETEAIALYLEDIKDGANFISAAAEVNCRKPIVMIKAGKNKIGQGAVSSHTGSLAQDEAVVSAVLEKFGIVEAESVEQFQDIVSHLNSNKILSGPELAVVTNAGGLGVLAADYIGKSNDVSLLKIPENIKASLRSVLPPGASVSNPIDILGDAPPERYKKVLDILAKKLPRHPILVLLTPQNQTGPTQIAAILTKCRNKFPALLTSFMGGAKIAQAIELLSKHQISNFNSPERALLALEKTSRSASCQTNIFSQTKNKLIKPKLKTGSIVNAANAEKRKMLYWEETDKIFAEYGIGLAGSIAFETYSQLAKKKLNLPCVLKTNDPKISHRYEKNAVVLNIRDRNMLKKEFEKMKQKTRAERFLLQPMQEKGLELIVGMKRDKSFGPVIIAGLGGTFTEIFKDSVIFIPPFLEIDVRERLQKLKAYPILKGFRGQKGYNLGEISRILLALQSLSAQNPGISEIDINPVILYNNHKAFQIVDAKIFLE